MTLRCPISRRTFLKSLSVGAVGLSLCGLSGCSAGSTGRVISNGPFSDTVTVLDSVGRSVVIPAPHQLRKVYFTSPLAEVFCFTVAPDLLAGTSSRYDEQCLEYLPESMGGLSYLGTLSNGGSIDIEALKYIGTQVVFSISGVGLTDVNISDALELEQQSGIPVVLIDGSFSTIGDTYRFLGECLGRAERGGQLASYCEEIYQRVSQAVARVPEGERVTYYFAEGSEGLSTENGASQHSVAFTAAGGINVAANAADPGSALLSSEVTIEQIRQWDPQYIIAWDYLERQGAGRLIRSSKQWADVRAVREDHVYDMPSLPFAFCDRPPGMNRFLGIQWLANLFYPQYYDVDMVEVVREFYSRCYWRDISGEQAREILGYTDA